MRGRPSRSSGIDREILKAPRLRVPDRLDAQQRQDLGDVVALGAHRACPRRRGRPSRDSALFRDVALEHLARQLLADAPRRLATAPRAGRPRRSFGRSGSTCAMPRVGAPPGRPARSAPRARRARASISSVTCSSAGTRCWQANAQRCARRRSSGSRRARAAHDRAAIAAPGSRPSSRSTKQLARQRLETARARRHGCGRRRRATSRRSIEPRARARPAAPRGRSRTADARAACRLGHRTVGQPRQRAQRVGQRRHRRRARATRRGSAPCPSSHR